MSQPITLDLPPPEQIVTEEIPVIGATLKSTAVFLGKYCDDLSKVSSTWVRKHPSIDQTKEEANELISNVFSVSPSERTIVIVRTTIEYNPQSPFQRPLNSQSPTFE